MVESRKTLNFSEMEIVWLGRRSNPSAGPCFFVRERRNNARNQAARSWHMSSLRRRSFGIECLERRTLMTADLVNGALTVVGTTDNDNIQVQVAVSGPH